MAKSTYRQKIRQEISPVLRPLLWSAVLGAAVAFAFANPVYADPAPPNTIPDSGSRPQLPASIGGIQLPGAPAQPGFVGPTTLPVASALNGPLAAQIYAQETQVSTLGDQLLLLRQSRDAADAELKVATDALTAAEADVTRAQQPADTSAAEAFKEAAALPPGAFGTDLHELGALGRLQKGESSGGDSTAPARELARATKAEKDARLAKEAAETRAKEATDRFTTAEASYLAQDAALRKLRADNAVQVAAIEQEQEAAEQKLGAQYLNGSSIAGKAASPRALAAVNFALHQLGDPYLWGAEGPNRFDCSGLMWAAYRSKGADYFDLPRVARDQYYATRNREVDRSALLPGDLLFFASNSSWTSVHHVGMYIGGGRMVHAPTTGDVVKISTVSWSRLYKATRIFGSVPAPVTHPNPPATTKPPATKPPATKPPTTKPPTSGPPTTPPTETPTTPAETPTAETPTPEPTPGPPSPPEDPGGSDPSGSTSG